MSTFEFPSYCADLWKSKARVWLLGCSLFRFTIRIISWQSRCKAWTTIGHCAIYLLDLRRLLALTPPRQSAARLLQCYVHFWGKSSFFVTSCEILTSKWSQTLRWGNWWRRYCFSQIHSASTGFRNSGQNLHLPSTQQHCEEDLNRLLRRSLFAGMAQLRFTFAQVQALRRDVDWLL